MSRLSPHLGHNSKQSHHRVRIRSVRPKPIPLKRALPESLLIIWSAQAELIWCDQSKIPPIIKSKYTVLNHFWLEKDKQNLAAGSLPFHLWNPARRPPTDSAGLCSSDQTSSDSLIRAGQQFHSKRKKISTEGFSQRTTSSASLRQALVRLWSNAAVRGGERRDTGAAWSWWDKPDWSASLRQTEGASGGLPRFAPPLKTLPVDSSPDGS